MTRLRTIAACDASVAGDFAKAWTDHANAAVDLTINTLMLALIESHERDLRESAARVDAILARHVSSVAQGGRDYV